AGERLAFGSTTGGLWVSEDQGDSWACITHTLPPVYAVRFAYGEEGSVQAANSVCSLRDKADTTQSRNRKRSPHVRGIAAGGGGRLRLSARRDRLIQFPFPDCNLVTHGIRLRGSVQPQSASASSSTNAQFENGAQRACLRARKHGEVL